MFSVAWSGAQRSRLRGLGGLGVWLAVACSAPPSPEPETPHLNVLLVVVDALRADRLGAAGYPLPTTPNIDRIAADGFLFRNAYAPATWTKPSMTTMMTSLHPSEHGLMGVGQTTGKDFTTGRLPRSAETLAERFQAGGWETFAVVNQVHLQLKLGFRQGFDRFLWRRGRSAFELNALFLDWFRARTKRPFFAWIHYLDTHWPYDSGLPDETGRFGPTHFEDPPPRRRGRVEAWAASGLDPATRAALAARYDQEVALVDAAIGELVEELRAAGELERTLIVVTADHGEGFLEHGRLMHSYEPYEEVARVPLVLSAPAALGLPAGVRRTPVGLVDLAPTLLDLAGAEPLPEARGESLRPVLEGIEEPDRPVFLQTRGVWGLRLGHHKLLAREGQRYELYDLETDPGETRNLAADGCGDLCLELLGRIRRFRATLASPPRLGREVLDDVDLEDLRSLGYL